MTHEESCGSASLLEVYRHYLSGSDNVVRWCKKCGAVVVDTEVDGRTAPGRIMGMKFPLVSKMVNREARIKAQYADGGGQIVKTLGPPVTVEGQEFVPILRTYIGSTEEELDFFKLAGLENP